MRVVLFVRCNGWRVWIDVNQKLLIAYRGDTKPYLSVTRAFGEDFLTLANRFDARSLSFPENRDQVSDMRGSVLW
jgi:hypothetical protein